MSSDHTSWTDFLMLAYHVQWPLYGSLAKTLADHHRMQKAASIPGALPVVEDIPPQAVWKAALMNAAVATLVFALVFPLSEEMGLNAGWQKVFLYMAGYMGFQLIDIVQAQARFRLNKFFGGEDNGADKR